MNRLITIGVLFYFIFFTGYMGRAEENKTTILNLHYERGVMFYKQGEYDKAIEELGRVLEIEPAHAKAKKYLTNAMRRKNKKIIDQLYSQASKYYKQKEYQSALDTYKKVLEILPNDGYSLYKIEELGARIEKLEKLKQNEQYKLKQRTDELNKLEKERKEKEQLLKKQAALELERREKEEQNKELDSLVEEKLKDKQENKEKGLETNIALERETISKQNVEIDEYAKKINMAKDLDEVEQLKSESDKEYVNEVVVSLAESAGAPPSPLQLASAISMPQESVLSGKIIEQEKLYKMRFIYELGKKYYNEGSYERAIEVFNQIIGLEKSSRILYTPYAKSYLDKAKEKLQKQIQDDKVRQVEDIEGEMINKVIEAAKISADPITGTQIKTIEMPAPEPPPDIHKKLNTPVNMDFQDVDVVYVLDYLSDATGANIVMSSAVTKGKRTVSVKIKDMSLDEALKYVLKSAGLTFRIDKNVIWIATPDEIDNERVETKVFTLKKGKGMFTEFKSLTTGGVGLGSSAEIENTTTIKDIIEKAVTWPANSKIVLDERLGALIITNTPYNLEIIEKILQKIDVEPVQILIEARFLEVSIVDLEELGIDWQLNSPLPFDNGISGEMKYGIGQNSGVAFTDTSRQSEGFNLTYQGLLSKPQFQLVLHALEESKKTKTLSAPRVTTLDNQMATIKVVEEWIYPTRYEFQIVQFDTNGDGDFNDANETQYQNVPADFVKRDVGILLRVTPSVGVEDEVITLTLIPEVSEAAAGFFTFTGNVSLPKFTSRNLSTTVVANSGDTIVLGGLIKESRTTTKTKVPILGDLPWIGPMFRKETDSITRSNLLIFVTATILSPSGKQVVLTKIEAPN